MTTNDNNNIPGSQPLAHSAIPAPQYTHPATSAPNYMEYTPKFNLPKKEKRAFTFAEKLLLLVALVVAILFDRLLLNFFTVYSAKYYAAFWMCFLAAFYLFYWSKMRRNLVSWYLTGCIIALCLWNFLFREVLFSDNFALINFPVIPAVMMGLVVYMTDVFQLKETGKIALTWLSGFFVKPFSAIPVFFGAIGASFFGEEKAKTKKIALGSAIAVALLLIILPLLSGADRVFGYHLMRMLSGFNFGTIIWHTVVISIAFMLLYSFMWNVGFGAKAKEHKKISAKIDTLISSIVLGAIAMVYVLFCVVQFTYLFAGAGLPGGMTYSEYAREGFAQTVAVCAINLLIFGVFLHFKKESKVTIGLLIALLALTGVMLFSGFIRLGLYIDAYGMTWLRLLSAWFIIYLAAVIIMCCVRLWRERLPLIAISALVLVGWYIILGYTNPDGMIDWYNHIYT